MARKVRSAARSRYLIRHHYIFWPEFLLALYHLRRLGWPPIEPDQGYRHSNGILVRGKDGSPGGRGQGDPRGGGPDAASPGTDRGGASAPGHGTGPVVRSRLPPA